jgi:anaerobic selenocysteine-containing dehydrogenase
MNFVPRVETRLSTCPHDCPSVCGLEVEVIDGRSIGRVRGSSAHSYTAGVVCAKVARYSERLYHPDRLMHPLLRVGPKGSGQFRQISWDEALDRTAEAFLDAERRLGSQSIWPYYYAGTMGYVMRDGINRLRNAKRYSGQYSTICTTPAWTGYIAGTGKLAGTDPREMARADCVVIWGTNPVHTQVNVMTHALRARKERGALIVVVDVYDNPTMKQADLALLVRPGTDGALACAVMHILFRDGMADREYLARYTDRPEELERHLATRTPEWAAAITGLTTGEIERFAAIVGSRKASFFRLGYGFSRSRNGAVNMHAALSIAAVTGAWQVEGGGAFHSNSGVYRLNKTLIEGEDVRDPSIRRLQQVQIGRILTGDAEALRNGPPVAAMLIQNTNPVSVAPEQEFVKRGFAREDLFTCVHEQVMTETARMADLVLPATMFLEHDDIYTGGGQQHIQLGLKLVDPPGECRSNHEVICDLAKRVGAEHPGFGMSPRELIDQMLAVSGRGTFADLAKDNWLDAQPPFEDAHYLNGFGYPDGKFRFAPDWTKVPNANDGPMGPWEDLPEFPDHWDAIEVATERHPFRLATSPARSFLNSSFNETPTSRAKEGGRPEVMIHPEDAAKLGVGTGDWVRLSNDRGAVLLRARIFAGVRPGVLIAESIWPNAFFPDGKGINTLTSADPVAPYGGVGFHDNRVALERIGPVLEGFDEPARTEPEPALA